MADLKKKISALPPDASPTTTDLMVTVDDGGVTRSITLAQLTALVSANLTDGDVTDNKWRNGVAFKVTASGAQNIPSGTDTTLNYDTVVYDLGSDFDLATETFVCPIDGIYSFQMRVTHSTYTGLVGKLISAQIFHNGASVGQTGMNAGGNNSHSMNVVATIPCVAGDSVTSIATQADGSTRAVSAGRWFSGFLVTRT